MARERARRLETLWRPPQVSPAPARILLVGIILLVVAWQVLQWQTEYLAQNSYSLPARSFVTAVSAPIGEESLKVGLVIVVGLLLSGSIAVGTLIGARIGGKTPPGLHALVRRNWRKMSVLVFLIVALVYAITESLGGGLDAGPVTPLGALLKLILHPSFSILAVLVALEARPRSVLFVALGYGLHSTMNLIVGHVTGSVQPAAYLTALFLIVILDLWTLLHWFPWVPAALSGILKRESRAHRP